MKLSSSLACTLLILATSTPPHVANTLYYVGPDNGNWSDAADWSLTDNGPGGTGPPASAETVFFTTTSNKTLNLDLPVASVTNIFFNGTPSAIPTLLVPLSSSLS